MTLDWLCRTYPGLTPREVLRQPWPIMKDLLLLGKYREQMRGDADG